MSADPSDRTRPQGIFKWFARSEASGAIVLMFCTLIALAWANSSWSDGYFRLAQTYIGVSWGDATFKMSLSHWIQDGLMAVFFFVVGLEIKREIAVGELSTLRKAILPVGAALGGAIVPALIYLALNTSGAAARGWGVPMATDIAFALGILSLFGKRVPLGLKVFLTALAIADDLMAVLVIALFYTERIEVLALVVAGAFMVSIVVAGRLGVRQSWIYLLLALGAWAGVLASGIHATIAGVLVAMLVPVKAAIPPEQFFARARRRLAELEQSKLTESSAASDRCQLHALDDLFLAASDMRPAGITLEHALHPVQSFLILPLFALFSAGVRFDSGTMNGPGISLPLGIVLGLVLGKQIGVMLAVWLTVRGGQADLPEGVRWVHMWGASCLAGIGFTMSIFIGTLAFPDPAMIAEAKVGILIASLIAGLLGAGVLWKTLPAATR